jgi:hypothetical protein
MNESMKRLFVGAAAGALATLPMSAVMLAWHRRLPWHKRDPLPPAQITKQVTKALGLHDELEHEGRLALTGVSHFGYGAAMGSLYGLAGGGGQPAGNAALGGAAFGFGVWAASYAGWLPAAGLYRSAATESRERNTMMIAAHLVWGAGLGLLVSALSRSHALSGRTTQEKPRKRKKSPRYGRRVRHRLREEQAAT